MSDEIEIMVGDDLIHFKIEVRVGDNLVMAGSIIESMHLLKRGSKQILLEKATKMFKNMLENLDE